MHAIVLAMRLGIRVLLHALRKPFVPPLKEGRRSADRRTTGSAPPQKEKPASVCGARYVRPCPALARDLKRRRARLFGAPPRSCAEGPYPRLGSGPRFLESPDPNGRTLSGTSAASTWQSDHAPDGRCPEPPGTTVYGRASGNRPRSTFESTLAKGPSVNEMNSDVIDTVTSVKGLSLYTRPHKIAIYAANAGNPGQAPINRGRRANFRFAAEGGHRRTPASCPLRGHKARSA